MMILEKVELNLVSFVQVLVKDLLRKYPQWSHDCIAVVGNISSNNIQEPKAKAALIWMLGEYAQDMQDSPYVLEGLVENWEEEHSAEVIRCHYLAIYIYNNFTLIMELFLSSSHSLRLYISDQTNIL